MNAVTITGNLTEDPKGVTYGDGQTLANFRIGNNERIGEENVLNGFFDVTAFKATAKNVLASLKKGDQVIVVGRLDQSSYENEAGEKRSRTKLVAQLVGVPLTFGTVTPSRKAEEAETEVTG